MTIHLLAFVLVGGMAVGDSGDTGAKAAALEFAVPATAGDARLERAARDYRIQTYETFHKDRAEYDRRSAEGARVEAAWKDAGRNGEEQPLLIHWFDQAKAVSRTDSIADLPPEPKFTIVPQKKEPEKKLVETGPVDSVDDAAAKVDKLLNVKPIGAATQVVDPMPTPPQTASAPPAKAAAPPQSKPSTIGSLPISLGTEISHTLQGLSGKLAPSSPSQGR